jgi:hypothetical protein
MSSDDELDFEVGDKYNEKCGVFGCWVSLVGHACIEWNMRSDLNFGRTWIKQRTPRTMVWSGSSIVARRVLAW